MTGAGPGTLRRFRVDHPLDLRRTLRGVAPLTWIGGEAWRSTRTAAGPATERIAVRGQEVEVEAWGPGADLALEAAPALLGSEDSPQEFQPASALLRDLHRRFSGMRIGRTGAVFEALLPAILAQKITGAEAHIAYRGILARFGEPSVGPAGPRVPPDPARLALLPYYEFHPFGVERRRAEVIRAAASVARRLEAGAPLEAVTGIGPWTAAETVAVARGDADAVSVGDYHLPNLVAWNLAGEPRADDARMLELLEPYRGHRLRVVRLLEAAGLGAPRWGPRMAFRPFNWRRV